MICTIYFALYEFIQMKEKRLEYLSSFWNYIDLGAVLINISLLFLDFAQFDAALVRSIAAFGALIMWFKLFYLLRLFFKTAFVVRMILEIVNDMKMFAFVFMLAIGAFAHGFYLLSLNGKEGMRNFLGGNFYYALAYSYKMGLGDFNTNDFRLTHSEEEAFVMWVLATLTMLIILLNMLIAIMGDTFERVQESSESSMLLEVAGMM